MAKKQTRNQIVVIADRLFYEQGFDHTSFADIAGAVKISRGNFYYHFKSKDKILDAVLALRLKNTEAMLDRWESEGKSPLERIRSFVAILLVNQTKIMAHGCPVGTLCGELAKLEHPALPRANQLFTLFRNWLYKQFKALGRQNDADALALHVLAFSQGVATLANAFRDEAFVNQEVERMNGWLETVAESAP